MTTQIHKLRQIVKSLSQEQAFLAGLVFSNLETADTEMLDHIANDFSVSAIGDKDESNLAVYNHYREALSVKPISLGERQALRTVQSASPSKVTLDHLEGSHPEIITPEIQIDTCQKIDEKTSFDCLLEDVPMVETDQRLPTDVDHESRELIKKLMAEESHDVQCRLETSADLRCKICLEAFSEVSEDDSLSSILPLQLCEHIFHTECMALYLQSQVDTANFPLRCPDPECRHEISDHDAKACLSPELFTKFDQLALNQAIDTNKEFSWCPTADCKYAFIFTDDETASSTTPGGPEGVGVHSKQEF